jgi:hypothetical protein
MCPLLATVWYLREPRHLCVSEKVSLVPRNAGSDPKLMIDGNNLVGVYPVLFLLDLLGYASFRVFRSTLHGYKPIGCQPLTVIRDCSINCP